MQPDIFSTLSCAVGPLSDIEKAVLGNIRSGSLTVVGDGGLPRRPSENLKIRAAVLNYVFRHGIHESLVTDFGVQIKGAWIEGEINLSGCVLPYGIRFINCDFSDRIYGPSAKIDRVNFQGSRLRGLYFERVRIAAYLLCNKGFTCFGKINLLGARVDGTLSFEGARIEADEPVSIAASRCKITDSLFFTAGFSTNGRIQLLGAQIGGQLSFSGSRVETDHKTAVNAQRATIGETIFIHKHSVFKGDIKLTGANVKGQVILRDLEVLSNEGGDGSVRIDGVRVLGSVVLKRLVVSGEIDAQQSDVGSLNDEFAVWRDAKAYQIEGLTYGRLHSENYDIHSRLAWLENYRQANAVAVDDDTTEPMPESFTPQPYQQLAAVIGVMGHRRDRNLVLFRMENRLKNWQVRELTLERDRSLDGTWKAGLHSFAYDAKLLVSRSSNLLLRIIVGYGYKPQNALVCALAVIGFTTILVQNSYLLGDFTPTAAPILISERWQELAAPLESGGVLNPAQVWTGETDEGRDYSTFNAMYYSADLFVPLVEFGQDNDWAPSTTRSILGKVLHWSEPIIRLIGWVVSALGAAALAGIVRND